MLSEYETKAIKYLSQFEGNYVKTILNLITKLQKENEYWKNGFERELEDNRKNTCELLKQDLILREKDKQIDLMVDRIEWLCKSNGILLDEEHDENFTQEDIKQYFEKLAKEKDNTKM